VKLKKWQLLERGVAILGPVPSNMRLTSRFLSILLTNMAVFSVCAAENMVDMKFATSKDSFMKGEPIIVTCTLLNLSSNIIDINLGYDRAGSFLFGLAGSQEHTNSAQYGGLFLLPHVQLKPGAAFRQSLILDEWSLPLKSGSNSITGSLEYGGIKLTSVFHVNLVEPTKAQLAAALGALVSKAATSSDIEEKNILHRALHTVAKRSSEVRALLIAQETLLKDIVENADKEIGD
jgi:hypothetical protein